MLSFLNCLDDILKQFTIVGSMKVKEQQAQQHKEHRDFPQGKYKQESPAKLPQYRTQQRQCETQR